MACWQRQNGTYNDTHIGIEICQGSNTDSVYFTKAYVEAVEVSVYLCKRFGWNDTNITTHCEAYKEGYGSNHGDVNSYFVHFGKSISTLRSDVKKILEGDLSEMYKIVIGSYETKEAAQTALDKFKELASIAKSKMITPLLQLSMKLPQAIFFITTNILLWLAILQAVLENGLVVLLLMSLRVGAATEMAIRGLK